MKIPPSHQYSWPKRLPMPSEFQDAARVLLCCGYFLEPCDSRFAFLSIKGDSLFFLSEGGSADYIITGAWSAKAAKEVKNVVVRRPAM